MEKSVTVDGTMYTIKEVTLRTGIQLLEVYDLYNKSLGDTTDNDTDTLSLEGIKAIIQSAPKVLDNLVQVVPNDNNKVSSILDTPYSTLEVLATHVLEVNSVFFQRMTALGAKG